LIIFIIPKNSGLAIAEEIINEFKGEIVEIRGEDVPSFVLKLLKENKRVIGITGEDLFKEFLFETKEASLEILKVIEWKDESYIFKKPALCLLGAKGKNLDSLPKNLKICINRKYKELGKKYCTNILKNKGYNLEKIYASGATEEFFSKGIVDLVIDIVCTGNSIKRYNLEIYEKLFESNLVVIGKKDEGKQNFQELYKKIQTRIDSGDNSSYTKKLFENPNLLRRKLVEEAAEVITENPENKERMIEEFSDLFYNILVYMNYTNITLKDIEEENFKRDKETLINPKNLTKSEKEKNDN